MDLQYIVKCAMYEVYPKAALDNVKKVAELVEEKLTSTNKQITPCLTCRFFAPMAGCTAPGDCLGYESCTA